MSNFKIVKAKSVKFQYNGNSLGMFVTDETGCEYSHRFSDKSKMFENFVNSEREDFEALFVGAPFVFYRHLDGHYSLVDFRTNRQKVFVQSEDNLALMEELLGVHSENKIEGSKEGRINTTSFKLGSEKFTYGFEVDGQSENEFEAQISLPFNPFSKTIGCSVGLERLICLNGMTTSASIFNYKIPVLNNVRENIEIGLSQVMPNIRESLHERLKQLQKERASLAESFRTHMFIENRKGDNNASMDKKIILNNLAMASNIYLHCKQYNKEVLENSQSRKFLPSHLTRFDVWNILTELDSHTNQTSKATSGAVQRYINTIMFNSATFCETNELAVTIENNTGRFNASHHQAFFGK